MRRKINALLLSLSLGLTAITCTLPASGVIAAEADTTGVTMYRLYNPNSGEHFYTKDASEKNNLVKAGWSDEGIGWIAPEKSDTPVYRLYNANAGDHHYTMNAKERDELVSAGWKSEDIGWYSDDEKSVPLYREYNPNAVTGTHNYTTDKAEHDNLVSLGWNDEGIGWYAIGDGKTEPVKDPDDDLKIGDIIILGTYEQDNDFTNGPEPIEWQYIADRDGHKMLLSKYALDYESYHDIKDERVTWETCKLRTWLNNNFYNTAFSASDKQRILNAHNEDPDSYELYKLWNTDNKIRGASGGNATDDKVFLLSWTEARDYLDGEVWKDGVENFNPKLFCKPTARAEARGLWADPNNDNRCIWLLRSPGSLQGSIAAVGRDGVFHESEMEIGRGVRPAILID